jgi:aromatic ring hydroxylase
MVPTLQRMASTVLRVNEALYQHIRTNIVLWDLPQLQESNLLEPSMHVAQAINELVIEQHATRADTIAHRLEEASTTPEGKWGPALEIRL